MPSPARRLPPQITVNSGKLDSSPVLGTAGLGEVVGFADGVGDGLAVAVGDGVGVASISGVTVYSTCTSCSRSANADDGTAAVSSITANAMVITFFIGIFLYILMFGSSDSCWSKDVSGKTSNLPFVMLRISG